MKNVILAAALAATFCIATASAAQLTLNGGLGVDEMGGGNQLTVAVLSASTITNDGIGLHADGVIGLRSANAFQTATLGTLYLPMTSGTYEIAPAADYAEDFGRLRLESGLDIGHASVLRQSDSHGAYQLRGGYSLGDGLTLDGQARVGVAGGGQLYAGADVGLSIANVAHGTVTASYHSLRDGSLPRQEIVSESYSDALRF